MFLARDSWRDLHDAHRHQYSSFGSGASEFISYYTVLKPYLFQMKAATVTQKRSARLSSSLFRLIGSQVFTFSIRKIKISVFLADHGFRVARHSSLHQCFPGCFRKETELSWVFLSVFQWEKWFSRYPIHLHGRSRFSVDCSQRVHAALSAVFEKARNFLEPIMFPTRSFPELFEVQWEEENLLEWRSRRRVQGRIRRTALRYSEGDYEFKKQMTVF